MRRTLSLLNLNCRRASRLLSDARERPLSKLERFGLRIHLLGCRSCGRYRHQLALLDRFVRPAGDDPAAAPTLPADARGRIERRLAEAAGDGGTTPGG